MNELKYLGFWNFIKFLEKNDFLKHVVIIGSWAEYLYQESGVLKNYYSNIKTVDIDFLVKNMRIPRNKRNLLAVAEESGYIIDFDYMTNASKIYTTDDNLEVEFLINQYGSGTKTVIETNLGVSAQALRHLSILQKYSKNIEIRGFNLTVPLPEAYLLHKIVINNERGKKLEKDKNAILNLWEYINEEKLEELISTLTKKELKAVKAFLTESNLEFKFCIE